jgi:DNA polymerase III subunit gamma/tau
MGMSEYLVLARKYRPQLFDDLVGQEVLVRTLTNAIAQNRIAHAFVLTGIRGIGKTTTARIMAKALNCLGADGTLTTATATPCGVCAHCVQITEGRDVDVIEMDAASQTGVEGVRKIIDAVHYKPVSARYKIYIVDEAHMLSNAAFNALLKTLEEPPAHIVFIFATTEIRKIPVTILSRCQRFDLRRLTTEEMREHLRSICAKESVDADEEALDLVAIAAEGSVRDGLSLLDQAIVHSERSADGRYHVTGEVMRGLLGLVDRTRLYTMLEHLFTGHCAEALDALAAHYQDGANMTTLIQDMLQAVHIISRLLVAADYRLDNTYSSHEKATLQRLATSLSIPVAARAWQLLMKGLEEVKAAPNALTATEMLFIRFAYTAEMPDPAKIIKSLREGKEGSAAGTMQPKPTGGGATASILNFPAPSRTSAALAPLPQETVEVASVPLSLVAHNTAPDISCFADILALCEREREMILLHSLKHDVRLVSCTVGELVISDRSTLKPDMLAQLKALLRKHGEWVVRTSADAGEPSMAEAATAHQATRLKAAKNHPLVISILETFEGAAMVGVETV